MRLLRRLLGLALLLAVALFALVLAQGDGVVTELAQRAPGLQNGDGGPGPSGLYVSEPVTPHLTVAARDLPLADSELTLNREINPRLSLNNQADPTFRVAGGPDPLVPLQASVPVDGGSAFLTPILNFAGEGATGVQPPDTVGDVGPNDYVQMVNDGDGTAVRIYDKSGTLTTGPFLLDTLGTGNCANGFGDPVVLYDDMADRWLFTEFSGSGNDLCVYVSQTPDPAGAFFAYNFVPPNFPDYPKYAVWSDAYYVTSNESGPSPVYALDRTQMLAGSPATFIRQTAPDMAGFSFQAMTPADLDGSTPPPANSPAIIMRHRDDEAHNVGSNNPNEDYLEIWEFDVDFATPGNTTFTKVMDLPVTEFDSDLCGFFTFSCIPQPSGGTPLDPLREVIMWRLVYRNFGSHEVLLGNLATDVTGTDQAGVRWFELRRSPTDGSGWSLYQEGTLSLDSDNRWMGSIAMDGDGNIALGYSISSSATQAGIRYAGRLASDPLGTMPRVEGLIMNGNGVHSGERWGDYAAMSIDPADDCTFWFTTEYANGSTWATQIASFKHPECGSPGFTLTADPTTQTICAPADAVYDLTIGSIQGFADAVTLSASGNPAGTTTNFSTNPVTPPGTSALTIGNTGAATAGSYSIDVVGIAPTMTLTTTVGLDLYDSTPGGVTLTAPADGATDVSFAPAFSWSGATQGQEYELEIATDNGFASIVHTATVASNSYVMPSNLTANTTYYWRVTPVNICGAGSTSAVFSFTVKDSEALACNLDVVTFAEGIPAGWTVVDNTGGSGIVWTVVSDSACGIPNQTGGTGEAACADSDAAGSGAPPYDTELVTDLIDVTGQHFLTLNFNGRYRDVGAGNDTFGVDMWDGSSWVNLLTWDSNHDGQPVSLNATVAGLSSTQFRFTYSGNGFDWYAQVDDVALSCSAGTQNYLPIITTP